MHAPHTIRYKVTVHTALTDNTESVLIFVAPHANISARGAAQLTYIKTGGTICWTGSHGLRTIKTGK
jgi:hypothetical protein